MGASTGNMLVEKREILMNIFAKSPLLIMTHCEDSGIIAQNMALYKQRYGADPPIQYHPQIRSRAACIASSKLAMELAEKTGAQLHIAHISTYEELEMLRKYRHEEGSQNIAQITGEACLAHLLFTDKDYLDLGARIKCNPSVKTLEDRETLRTALNDGTIFIIGTDHAPHLPEEKVGGCIKAASGIPMIQFSLVSMLELAEKNVLNIPQVVTLMCHNPAKRFNIKQRGFIREGYNADIVLVRPHTKWTLKKEMIESKCGWSPLEGHTFSHQVVRTYCNGHCVYNNGVIDDSYRGEELVFEH
jgi:dihydroorotase